MRIEESTISYFATNYECNGWLKNNNTKAAPESAGNANASPGRAAPPSHAATSLRATDVVGDPPAHERSSATEEKNLATLSALSDRMGNVKTIQMQTHARSN